MAEYPFVEIRAYDPTDPETYCTVRLTYEAPSNPIPGVTEQDIVDVVKNFLDSQSGISVTATRYEVAGTPV